MPGLSTYSKTLDVADYPLIPEAVHIQNIKGVLGPAQFAADHQHRTWEYGLLLNALRENGAHSVLDVGGNGSAFAPAAAWVGMEVCQIDPSDCGRRIADHATRVGTPLSFIQKDFLSYNAKRKFDGVTCISVLEHIPEDIEFFEKLLSFVKKGGLLAITVDFHPDGVAKQAGHLRTYNNAAMLRFIDLAKKQGFEMFRGEYDYTYRGEDVFQYTFASLVMKKSG